MSSMCHVRLLNWYGTSVGEIDYELQRYRLNAGLRIQEEGSSFNAVLCARRLGLQKLPEPFW